MEVELVGDAGAEIVLVVADQALEGVGAFAWLEAPVEVAEVGAHAAAGKDADASALEAATRQGRAAGVLESLPAGLEEEPLLGIYLRRFAAGVAEEGRVELVDVFKKVAGLDVGRVVQKLVRHALGRELAVVQKGDAHPALAEVRPVLLQVACPREPAAHADDGNALFFDVADVHSPLLLRVRQPLPRSVVVVENPCLMRPGRPAIPDPRRACACGRPCACACAGRRAFRPRPGPPRRPRRRRPRPRGRR